MLRSIGAPDIRSRQGTPLKERAATARVLLAAGGAVWFGALSLLSARVYEPVRLNPRDLGLTSSAILAQATVGLVVTVVVGVLAGALAGGVLGAWTASRDPELREIADTTPLPFVSDDPVSNAAATAR